MNFYGLLNQDFEQRIANLQESWGNFKQFPAKYRNRSAHRHKPYAACPASYTIFLNAAKKSVKRVLNLPRMTLRVIA
jgi:hypothetical protein